MKKGAKIALIVALALVLLLAAAGLKLFVIGSRVSGGVACRVQVDGKHLSLDATETGSAGVLSSIRFSEEDGVVTVHMRRVLVGLLSGVDHAEYDAKDEITEVRFNGEPIWSGRE